MHIWRLRCHCKNCGTEYYPLDEELELSRSKASKHLAKAVTWLSVFMPFNEVKKIFAGLLGVAVSTTFIEQVAVRVGDTLWEKAETESRRPYAIEEREKEVDTLYICPDGAMVPLVGDGKVEYKENKLGIVFNNRDLVRKVDKKGKITTHITGKKLISSLAEGTESFKKMLFAAAVKKGFYSAQTVIFLSDGAIWLGKCKEELFPQAVRILDWYHALEHLWETARSLFGEQNEVKCRSWVVPLQELLWTGKVDEVIHLLENEINNCKKNQQPLIELRGYYHSNRSSMRYDKYREKGWYIGSGPVESANKYIVNQRLKQSGMKWSKTCANAILWARCKYYENEWDEFWKRICLPEFLNRIPCYGEQAA